MKPETIKAGGFTFSYLYRKGDKPLTLVLIHGLGATKESFAGAFTYPGLSGYGILAPDLPGHGDTEAPEGFGFTMGEHAEAVRLLMDALGVTGGVALLLHSMGGPVGVSLAETLPGRVIGVVYMEGNVDLGDCFGSGMIIRDGYDAWVRTGYDAALAGYRRAPGGEAYAAAFSKAGPVTLYRSSIDLVEVSRRDTITGRLVDLRVPVLSVYGELNRGRWGSEGKLAAHFPQVFIPGAGHGLQMENPEAFYHEAAHFIEALSPG